MFVSLTLFSRPRRNESRSVRAGFHGSFFLVLCRSSDLIRPARSASRIGSADSDGGAERGRREGEGFRKRGQNEIRRGKKYFEQSARAIAAGICISIAAYLSRRGFPRVFLKLIRPGSSYPRGARTSSPSLRPLPSPRCLRRATYRAV